MTEKISHAMTAVAWWWRAVRSARAGARLLVKIGTRPSNPNTTLSAKPPQAWVPCNEKKVFEPPPRPKGRRDKGAAGSGRCAWTTSTRSGDHNNPMELFATTAVLRRRKGSVTVSEKTKDVQGSQKYI